jgi:tRNA-dihydrouridine synthase C
MEGLLDYMLRDTLTRAALAGVERVTESGPRPVAHAGAAPAAGSHNFDACISEFIRITDTLLPRSAFLRIVPELLHGCRTPAGVPVRVQLLGSDPVCLAENAARAAQLGAFGIDLNFGCPARTVNLHRGGAVLLKEPELLCRIVEAVRRAVPPTIPVTAKMRLGYDTPEHAVVCAQALSAGGAAEIAVHARTKLDGYRPPAYWEWIAKVRESVDVPVVANGEIWNVDDARRCLEISGCDAIMIGRGAVANPALAAMIRGRRETLLAWSEMRELLHHHWLIVGQYIQPRHRGGRIKQWLFYLTRHYPEAQREFDIIRRMTTPEEITDALFAGFCAALPPADPNRTAATSQAPVTVPQKRYG